jgi:hypothetical protein
MARIAALVFATALVCAGCGSVEGERTTTKGVTISPPGSRPAVPHAAERRGSWSMMAFGTARDGGEESSPLAESLHALTEPRTPDDKLPEWGYGMLDGVSHEPGYDPGTPLESESRRLIGPETRDGYAIYALPTTNGWVCMVGYQQPSGGGSGGCDASLADGVALDIGGDGEAAHVGGLRADDVTAVDVVIDGEPHSARLGRNAFMLELSMDELCRGTGLDKLVVHRDGGATATVPLRSPLGPPGASSCG